VEAWNGQVAVELAREMSFDLVISDVCMPDMSGIELLKALHEHDPDLPVILTSGSLEPHNSLEASSLGAFAYLEKPVPFHTMRDVASRAIEQRRARNTYREQLEPCESGERLRVASRGHDDDDTG
jgi:two-component system response regulator HydG